MKNTSKKKNFYLKNPNKIYAKRNIKDNTLRHTLRSIPHDRFDKKIIFEGCLTDYCNSLAGPTLKTGEFFLLRSVLILKVSKPHSHVKFHRIHVLWTCL